MADGTWQLRDSPIFWWEAGAAPPGPPITGATSYHYGFNWVPIEGGPTPEVRAKIAMGDKRYMTEGSR